MARVLAIPAPVTDTEIDEAFLLWLDQVRRVKKARAATAILVAKMPWWAQPGPRSVNSDGSSVGGITWVPAILDAGLPQGGAHRVIRPSEYDFRTRHADNPFGLQEWRDKQLARNLAALAERYAARDHEMDKAGVSAARDHETEVHSRLSFIGQSIKQGPPSPARLAFRTIDNVSYYSVGSACFSRQCDARRDLNMDECGHVLRNLIPILPPVLRSQAERIIKPGAGPMAKWPYWLGLSEPYNGGGDRPLDLPTQNAAAVAPAVCREIEMVAA